MNLSRLLTAALCVGLFSARLCALSVVPPTFGELVGKAEIIVQTEITATRCEWRNSPRGMIIVTVVTAKILDTIKGTAAGEIEFEQLGGQLGTTRMEVEDLPKWKVGDRDYLFFAGKLKHSVCPLVGIPHGRYPLLRDAEADTDHVGRANHEPLTSADDVARSLSASGGGGDQIQAAHALSPKEFRTLVRSEMFRQESSPK